MLANRAGQLLDRIREAMLEEVKGSPSGYWELLPESERSSTQRRFAVEGGGDAWDSVVESGDFTLYLPASALVRLIERRPESFLDSKVFRRPYVGLTDESSRSLVVSRLGRFHRRPGPDRGSSPKARASRTPTCPAELFARRARTRQTGVAIVGGFLDPTFILGLGPNQFPRQIERLLWHIGFTDVV